MVISVMTNFISEIKEKREKKKKQLENVAEVKRVMEEQDRTLRRQQFLMAKERTLQALEESKRQEQERAEIYLGKRRDE